jgi:hypothetical protein
MNYRNITLWCSRSGIKPADSNIVADVAEVRVVDRRLAAQAENVSRVVGGVMPSEPVADDLRPVAPG